ncbi:MAG: DUF2892 domain-containing protein [Legionellaceae bacterium]|nr:DUF2892 domain-containing protein [Legionellaceae bacterium]
MFVKKCNIDKTDRINRIVFGVILCLAAMFGMRYEFYIIAGIVLIIEGIIGWCSIPILVTKIKNLNTRKNSGPL